MQVAFAARQPELLASCLLSSYFTLRPFAGTASASAAPWAKTRGRQRWAGRGLRPSGISLASKSQSVGRDFDVNAAVQHLGRLAVASDGIRAVSVTSPRILSFSPACAFILDRPLLAASTEVTGLISTTKGIFVGVGGRQLTQVSGGAIHVLNLLGNADIGGLTSATDGRIWATDRAIARVVAITLP